MKNMKCIYLFSVICICFLFSCEKTEEEKKFFDVPGYFKSEIENIKATRSEVSKSSKYNEHSSSQVLGVTDVNWEKELAIFIESDINKPIYHANMQRFDSIDSVNRAIVNYQCRSNKASIQHVEITYNSATNSINDVKTIRISIDKSNLISVTAIEALYIQGERYKITGKQTIRNLGDENSFFVEGRFTR